MDTISNPTPDALARPAPTPRRSWPKKRLAAWGGGLLALLVIATLVLKMIGGGGSAGYRLAEPNSAVSIAAAMPPASSAPADGSGMSSAAPAPLDRQIIRTGQISLQ